MGGYSHKRKQFTSWRYRRHWSITSDELIQIKLAKHIRNGIFDEHSKISNRALCEEYGVCDWTIKNCSKDKFNKALLPIEVQHILRHKARRVELNERLEILSDKYMAEFYGVSVSTIARI